MLLQVILQLYLSIWHQNMVGKFGITVDVRRRGQPWEDYTYHMMCTCPPYGVAHVRLWRGWNRWVSLWTKSWHILQYPIPDVWQLVLAKVPV